MHSYAVLPSLLTYTLESLYFIVLREITIENRWCRIYGSLKGCSVDTWLDIIAISTEKKIILTLV